MGLSRGGGRIRYMQGLGGHASSWHGGDFPTSSQRICFPLTGCVCVCVCVCARTRPDAEKLLARNENTTEVKTAASHVCAGQTRGGGAPGNVPLSAGTRKSRGRGVGHPRRSPHCGTNPRPHAQPQTAPGTPLAPPRLGLPPCAFTRCPACNTKLPDS